MKLREIARAIGCELRGDGDVDIVDVASLEDAGPGALTFLADRKHASKLASTRASAVVLDGQAPDVALPSLRAPHAYLAFVDAVALLHPAERPAAGVDPSAVIAPTARLGARAFVGPRVVIGDGCAIGEDAVLHAHVVLYAGVTVGKEFTAHAGAVVRERVRIGDRVTLHAGAVIGSDGFGYLPTPELPRKIPQVGTVVLEDDVEVGANATVDRAALGATVVGRGTKIDNLVMVGHGCRTGPGCLLAAQVGLSGGTVLGTGVMMGGQAGSSGHLTVGDRAQIGAKAGIHRDIPPGGVYSGYPAVEIRQWRRASVGLGRLPDALRRLRRVEGALGLDPDEKDPE
jgi:UDP-3-O-[3-hydroxymyristoyl] glucosamine N-acyltransferase